MLVTAFTLVLFAATVTFIYYLGYVQGKYVQRARTRKEVTKTRWMLNESLQRWAPWTLEPSEARARLASEYEEPTADRPSE